MQYIPKRRSMNCRHSSRLLTKKRLNYNEAQSWLKTVDDNKPRPTKRRKITTKKSLVKRNPKVSPLASGQPETTTPPITPPPKEASVSRVTSDLPVEHDYPEGQYPYKWFAMGPEGTRPNVFIPKQYEHCYVSNNVVEVKLNQTGRFIIENVGSSDSIPSPCVRSRKFTLNNDGYFTTIKEH